MEHRPDPPAGQTTVSPSRRLARGWLAFWRQPEALLLQASATAELVVAKMRLLVVGLMLLFAGYEVVHDPHDLTARLGLGTALVGCAAALGIFLFVRRALFRPWMGLAASALDAVLVTMGLSLPLLVSDPRAAAGSQVLFCVYFLVISSTTVRMDHRGAALTGAFAVAGYGCIAAFTALSGGGASARIGPLELDAFLAPDHVGRIALLGCAGLVATMIIRRAQRVRLLSATDPLTGLMNRRTFDERLAEECSRARRYGRDISLMMIDIDYFKQFNDTYGHACGDEALCSVATTLKSRLRTGDVVARYGGEEFVVILPETSAHTAMNTAEMLRRAVTSTPLRYSGQREPLAVTVSIGVASWPDRGTEISRLQYIADKHLYEAKLAGRDQVKGPAPARSVALSA